MSPQTMPTYELGADPEPFILCRRCSRKSYNANDIAQKYCGACHAFHGEGLRTEFLLDHELKYVVALITREHLEMITEQGKKAAAIGYNPEVLAQLLPVVNQIIREFNREAGIEGIDQLASRLTIASGGPG